MKRAVLKIGTVISMGCLAVCLVYLASSSDSHSSDMSSEAMLAHSGRIPGNIIYEEKRLSPQVAEALVSDPNIKHTPKVRPQGWPADGGSFQFYFKPEARIYWIRRYRFLPKPDDDFVSGPFGIDESYSTGR